MLQNFGVTSRHLKVGRFKLRCGFSDTVENQEI
jgi:hypothetical protein